jgi:FkbM family methyltransferase
LKDQWDDATFGYCAAASYGFFYSTWIENMDASVFIDVGANQGLYSLIAAQNPKISSVYAFEPQPEVFDNLEKNIKRNSAQTVCAFPYAISSKCEKREMFIKKGHSGAGTLREELVPQSKFGSSVRIVTVDKNFIDSNITVPAGAKVALKIDTEGHEAQVLHELMHSSLWGKVYNIFYEVDEMYIDNVEILNQLKADGFVIKYKNGSGSHYDLMLER